MSWKWKYINSSYKWKGQRDSLFSHHLVLIIKWLSRHPSTEKVDDISKWPISTLNSSQLFRRPNSNKKSGIAFINFFLFLIITLNLDYINQAKILCIMTLCILSSTLIKNRRKKFFKTRNVYWFSKDLSTNG